MENASKALIIAGAILLSIAIIGIGMTVYQMASSTIGSINMSESEILTYNAKFDKYLGTQTGSTVRAMMDTIRIHNSTQDDTSKQIVVNGNSATTNGEATAAATDCTTSAQDAEEATADLNTIKSGIRAGTRYTITFGYSTTGLIKRINIQQAT